MSNSECSDPAIDEIRAVRHQISARFGHDLRKLIEDHIELQKRYADRLIFLRDRHDSVDVHVSLGA